MDFLLAKRNSSPLYQVYNSFQRTTESMSPPPNTSSNYYDDYYDPVMASTCTMEHIKTFTSTFFPVLYSILFVTGLMGNALVVWVLIVCRKINAMTDVYLLNLAFSDLLFVFSLPFLAHYSAGGHWPFGKAMCKVISSTYFIGFYSSAFFITIMSIDRYLAIVRSVYALRVRTAARGAVTSLLLWA
ncbi:C-C chemokine receptor type 8-like, partial [Nothoprocta perdicaria]|uniref:C-C chemokine receptor type 8-like n=1 Tax=Nothoprocta perdicaria TaxID=30464 RepID=UPI000E1BEA43